MAKLTDVTEPCPAHRLAARIRNSGLARFANRAGLRTLYFLRDRIDRRLLKMQRRDTP